MPSRASIDSAGAPARVLRHVRGDPAGAHGPHATPRVVALVRAEGLRMEPAFARLIQEHGDRIPLRRPRGIADQEVHQQAVAVLHQRVGHEHQFGLLPLVC